MTPVKNWPGAATTDVEQVRTWWDGIWGDALPAIPTGGRFDVVDLDVNPKKGPPGEDAFCALGCDPEDALFTVRTPSGGRHLYFAPDRGLTITQGEAAPNLDTRGKGGFVFAPGAVDARGEYEIERGDLIDLVLGLSPFPSALSRALRKPGAEEGREAPEAGGEPLDRLKSALACIPNDGTHAEWVEALMAVHHATGGSADGLALALGWSAGYSGFSMREVQAKWRSFGKRQSGEPVTAATLYRKARVGGWAEDLSGVLDDLPEDQPEDRPDDDLDSDARVLLGLAPTPERPVMRRKNGEPDATAYNAIIYLEKANRQRGLGIRHNALTGQDEWKVGEIRDADLTLIRVEIERAGLQSVGDTLTARAVRTVAERNAYHPVRAWLAGLRHDGHPRLDTWLTDYLGAEDSTYVRAVGRAALIGLVARVMRPGCKHDHVLTLTGPQGGGKSTACRVLGGEWYGDNLPSLSRDDVEASRWLRGHWLVELSEMAPTRKAAAETLKSFLSRTTDKVRAPYARLAESVRRQCAFIATTNESQFLRDPTGGRRFWPVAVGAQIDTDALAGDRDQLFAEALAAFRAGEPWHLAPEIEDIAREVQDEATEEDPWAAEIADYLDGTLDEDGDPLTEVRTADVLAALGLPARQRGGTAAQRAAAIIRGRGWRARKVKGVRSWVRPS